MLLSGQRTTFKQFEQRDYWTIQPVSWPDSLIFCRNPTFLLLSATWSPSLTNLPANCLCTNTSSHFGWADHWYSSPHIPSVRKHFGRELEDTSVACVSSSFPLVASMCWGLPVHVTAKGGDGGSYSRQASMKERGEAQTIPSPFFLWAPLTTFNPHDYQDKRRWL